jgi:biotin carboxylase
LKLLILGAGIYQLPAIRRAREMGIETIVLSAPGNYPGIAAASRFVPVDTTNIDACLQVARRERINGVLSPGTDVAIPTLGAIVDSLSLPGPSREAALRAADKRLMKASFARAGVRSPAYHEVASADEAFEAASSIAGPSILKVADSSGSRGVERIDDPSDVYPAFERCRCSTRTSTMLVEQFIQGDEFGAQAFVASGRLQFVMPHGDTIRHTSACSVPVGHHVPLPLAEDTLTDIRSQVALCVDALGLDDCALNVDFIQANGKVHVIEIGARSGATCLAEMVSAHYGLDYYEYMIRSALGQAPTWAFLPQRAVAAALIASETTGTLTSIPQPPWAEDLIDYTFDYGVGDQVRRFTVGPDRIGHLVVTAHTSAAALLRVQKLVSSLHFDVYPTP